MSILIDPAHPLTPYRPEEDDPFRYGIRYQRTYRDDGTFTVQEIPLRKEDLLFPEEGDRPVVTDGHVTDLTNLRIIFKTKTQHASDVVVVSDLRVDFESSDPDIRPLGPDVGVFEGVRRRRDWSTLYVRREGARARLIVEVTSPDTRKNDLEIKVDLYFRVGVECYVIVDREQRGDAIDVHILGYQRGKKGFVSMAPDKHGRLWLEAVSVWLGVEDNQAVCFEPDGTRIPNYSELTSQVSHSAQMLVDAERRAVAARAVAEQALAAVEQARAKEAEARAAAEQRTRELEAELARLRGVP